MTGRPTGTPFLVSARTVHLALDRKVKPASRTPSGYRDYAEGDADRLTFIKTAQRLGLSLDEIREIIALRDRGQQPCGYVAQVLDRQVAQLDERIREMRRLRGELRAMQAMATDARDPGNYCGLIEHAAI